MATYQTLAELQQAYKTDKNIKPLSIDNDDTHAYRVDEASDPDWLDAEKVFEMGPETLLEQALDLLGIPQSRQADCLSMETV